MIPSLPSSPVGCVHRPDPAFAREHSERGVRFPISRHPRDPPPNRTPPTYTPDARCPMPTPSLRRDLTPWQTGSSASRRPRERSDNQRGHPPRPSPRRRAGARTDPMLSTPPPILIPPIPTILPIPVPLCSLQPLPLPPILSATPRALAQRPDPPKNSNIVNIVKQHPCSIERGCQIFTGGNLSPCGPRRRRRGGARK